MIRTNARRFPLALCVLLAPGVAGCGEDPTGGETKLPGEMVATLTSPAGDEGAVVLEVTSGNVLSVSSDDPDLLVFRVATQPVRIVAVRGPAGAIAFRIATDDVTHPPELQVVEVGGPDDVLRTSQSGYAVALTMEGGS